MFRVGVRSTASASANANALARRQARLLVVRPSRLYSTSPNQQQVLQSFGTPFAQFVHTLSRIARMITFSALGLGLVSISTYELTHQYIEFYKMPAASASSNDPYGWASQAEDESWGPNSGTDSRLGLKGRHAVRSAWMSVNWGGGISPSIIFSGTGNSGLGRTAVSSVANSRSLHIEDGMILAARYMDVALQTARERGITLPDPSAIALEYRSASIRERQGSPVFVSSAIDTFERIYDALQPSDAAKRVRLANKLGDLNAALGKRDEAERWLLRAVDVARDAGAAAPPAPDSVLPHTDDPSHKSSSSRGWFSGWRGSKKTVEVPAAPTVQPGTNTNLNSITTSAGAPTPVLTRSLLSTLLSLSALYAQNPARDQASLRHALQIQASAHKLADLELASSPSTTADARLHRASVLLSRSILALHLAETVYALQPRQLTRPWLVQASADAESALAALDQSSPSSSNHALALFADRITRDAPRVLELVQKLDKRL